LLNSSWKYKYISLRIEFISYFEIFGPCFYFRNLSMITYLMVLEILSFKRLNFPEFTKSFKKVSFFLLSSLILKVEMLLALVCLLSSICYFYWEKHATYSCEIAFILLQSSLFNTDTGWTLFLVFNFGQAGINSSVSGEIFSTFGFTASERSNYM
jgi:hypothetical protein